MYSAKDAKKDVFKEISNLLENKGSEVTEDMPLIGTNSELDSMKLVELCLLLEDKATEIGFVFDWTSDSAMSHTRSMFRTAGALANEYIRQLEEKK